MKRILAILAAVLAFGSVARGQSLTGSPISGTYKDLLHISNANNGLTSSALGVYDGAGNASGLSLSLFGNNTGVNTTSPNSILHVQGPIATAIVTKTAAYTLTALDSTVICNAATASFTVTLPTAVGIAGRTYTIKKIDTSAHNVTIATTSSQKIDAATTKVLTVQWSACTVQSDGANWISVTLPDPAFPLAVANGGTGLSTLTAGRVPYGAGTGAFGNAAGFTYASNVLTVPALTSTGDITANSMTVGNRGQSDATFLGFEAGLSNGGLSGTTAVGFTAARNTMGGSVTAIGYQAAYYNYNGYVTAVGSSAAYNNTSGTVTAVGWDAAFNNTTGSVTAVGHSAAYGNSTGSVTAVGTNAAYSSSTGLITTVGDNACFDCSTATITAIGDHAGRGTGGDESTILDTNVTFIGAYAGRDGSFSNYTALDNATALGAYAKVGTSNTVVLGNTSVTDVYAGGMTGAGTVHAAKFQLSALNTAPATATSAGVRGEIRIVSGFIYVCVATNSWQRAAIAAW